LASPNPNNVKWHDSDTPVICGTCKHIAQLGDGQFICLRRSGAINPYLFVINPMNNAAQCDLWTKGKTLKQLEKQEKSKLSADEINKLSGK